MTHIKSNFNQKGKTKNGNSNSSSSIVKEKCKKCRLIVPCEHDNSTLPQQPHTGGLCNSAGLQSRHPVHQRL